MYVIDPDFIWFFFQIFARSLHTQSNLLSIAVDLQKKNKKRTQNSLSPESVNFSRRPRAKIIRMLLFLLRIKKKNRDAVWMSSKAQQLRVGKASAVQCSAQTLYYSDDYVELKEE